MEELISTFYSLVSSSFKKKITKLSDKASHWQEIALYLTSEDLECHEDDADGSYKVLVIESVCIAVSNLYIVNYNKIMT